MMCHDASCKDSGAVTHLGNEGAAVKLRRVTATQR